MPRNDQDPALREDSDDTLALRRNGDESSDADRAAQGETPKPCLADRLRAGEMDATGEFFSRVYAELHRIARSHMAQQGGAHTLQPTALVHEVYLKLAGKGDRIDDEAHFLNLAARAMRQVLVDHARRRNAQSRRPGGERVPLDALVEAYEEHTGDLLELEDMLMALEQVDPELVQMVELRFYAGRTTSEIADVLGRSMRDVERRWEMTRRIVSRELER
ncbi:ECF sigma factor [Planctomycetes bacterium Pla163]|uniref:ECF sigma factor n=1 Tax=Rohdeia mirabilis TaxID=2528008 RepID=A0A518CYI8_9BACT|nr:ECF sigma factor [Planctomycetes bacterium Pla163]